MPSTNTSAPEHNRSLENALQCGLNTLLAQVRAPQKLPETGPFQPIQVTLPETHQPPKTGPIHLILRAGYDDDSDWRFLDVRVESPSGYSAASPDYPLMGRQPDILRALESQKERPEHLLHSIYQAIRLLQQAGKA